MAEDREELLRLLNAHGQEFLGSFGPSFVGAKRKSREALGQGDMKKRKLQAEEELAEETSGTDEEWTGFSEEGVEAEDNSEDDGVDLNDHAHPPNVVIFSEGTSRTTSTAIADVRAQKKAFMSSKISKLGTEISGRRQRDEQSQPEDDDLTNAENDALLHRLVHTQILSGSLNPELNLTSAQKRKALAGRVLEVAGHAKLGKGEHAVRSKEWNHHAKHVREGLLAKKKERSEKELEEAKNMGNYHPALKQLFADDTTTRSKPKRERGLRMGVGSFSGGVLRLSKSEVASVNGPSSRPFKRKGGRKK